MSRQKTAYVLTLRPLQGTDEIRALRAVLKRLLRTHGLRCVSLATNQTVRRRRRIVSRTASQTREQKMTNLKKYGPGNKWIKLEDVFEKPPLRERIGLVRPEKGKFGERLVLTFEPSGKMLSLNKTSVGQLLEDLGDDDSGWIGKLVEVYAGEVEAQSGRMDAVLVRAVDSATKSENPAPDDNQEIPF
jgi:hypothetical protein